MRRPLMLTTAVLFAAAIVPCGMPVHAQEVSPAVSSTPGPANPSVPVKWSKTTTTQTPAGKKTLHGPFNNDLVTVTAENLPAHEWLQITVELAVLRTWDGSVPITEEPDATGPDYFSISLSGGPTLVYTTFSNLGEDVFEENARFQNFPSLIPGDRLPARSGAQEKNTLGYEFTRSTTGVAYKMDTTYRISLLVPHKDAKAAIDLAAMDLQAADDESWGVLDVQVQPLAAAAVPGPAEDAIAKAFAEGVKADAADPITALRTLVSGRDATVQWIAKNVTPKPISAADSAAIMKKLVEPANDMEVNESRGKLVEMGPQTEVLLREAYKKAEDHTKPAIDGVLWVLGVTPVKDEGIRRVMLATRVLEVIGTPEALALRGKLAVQ